MAEIEAASVERPVSVDTAGWAEDSFQDRLADELARAEVTHARHTEIFRPDGRYVPIDDLDLLAIFDNTRNVLGIERPVAERTRALLLGLSITQLGGLAVATAQQPDLLRAPSYLDPVKLEATTTQRRLQVLTPDDLELTAIISAHCDTVTRELFQNELSPIISGDIYQIPFYKFSCAGFMLDIYYRFWEQLSAVRTLPDELQTDLDKLMRQYPAKTAAFDGHTVLGRPSFDEAKAQHQAQTEGFAASLTLPAPKGADILTNLHDALKVTFLALDYISRQGYSQLDSQRIVAQHIAKLGDLADRANIDLPLTDSFSLSGNDKDPILTITHPTDEMESDPISRKKLQRGGIRPARHEVTIPEGGTVFQGAQAVTQALHMRLGVQLELIRRVKGTSYIKPAEFIVAISLLGIIDNS